MLRAIADSYEQTFGLRIVLVETGGIPVSLADSVTYKGRVVDALAHSDRPCAWAACEAPRAGAWVSVSRALLGDKSWALFTTLAHELGHLAAGDFAHLPELAGVMAPGCRNRVCSPWTEADAEFICAAAPCTIVSLP